VRPGSVLRPSAGPGDGPSPSATRKPLFGSGDAEHYCRTAWGYADRHVCGIWKVATMTMPDEAISALQIFKNIILEGPPGTGKSYAMAAIAEKWPNPIGKNREGERAEGN